MMTKLTRAATAINFRCPPELYDELVRIGKEVYPTPGGMLDFNQGRTLKLLIKAGIEAINSQIPEKESDRISELEARIKQLEDLILGDGK